MKNQYLDKCLDRLTTLFQGNIRLANEENFFMQYKPDPSNYKELFPGIFMKTLTFGENSLLCEFQLKQGSIIPAHQHPQEQTGYLVHGSLRFFGDEGEIVVETGCSWNFKGGVIHGAEVLVDSVVIEVFSPLRQDYLPQK